eukprot:TRINITY_DN17837_c0_g1_i1.p1 TRINITY_DN17837_c0_g1~~TRINITY_DN17837_c0_g1_i1.p1  ORF type:complete len:312 (+),score=71.48 TRINITY_DN17837_c0_g1_i1:106-1041(+)
MLGATSGFDLKKGTNGGGNSTASPSEDGDGMSSVSANLNDRNYDASRRDSSASVMGLRDQLLREARIERQRCLVQEERRKSLDATSISKAAGLGLGQTVTDLPSMSPSSSIGALGSVGTGSLLGTTAVGTGSTLGWSRADDEAQAEALRTIQLLGSKGSKAQCQESRMQQLECELQAEKSSRQELETQLTHERSRKEAAQQQVLCLEYELDGKEAALQVAERTLERRDADLQQAQLQIRAMEGGLDTVASMAGGEDARMRALRAQLAERERQLELKDQHIARLLNVIKQHKSSFADDPLSHSLLLGGGSAS